MNTPKFRRKTYDATFRARLIKQAFGGKPVSEICKQENIQPYQLYAWIGERELLSQSGPKEALEARVSHLEAVSQLHSQLIARLSK